MGYPAHPGHAAGSGCTTNQVDHMSVGLLRVLVQSQVIVGNQAEHFQKALNEHKSIMPMLFEEGII